MTRDSVVFILLGLLILALSGCGPEWRLNRDAKLLGKIKARSPKLFKTEFDTVFFNEPVDSIGMSVETDTASFIARLKEYEMIVDSLNNLNNNDITENAFQTRRILFEKKKNLTNKLIEGAFVKSRGPLIDKNGRFNLIVEFDPTAKTFSIVKGTINYSEIRRTETITIKMKPTWWETIKVTWPLWIILFILIFILLKK
jgi:phage anti-repressor protein